MQVTIKKECHLSSLNEGSRTGLTYTGAKSLFRSVPAFLFTGTSPADNTETHGGDADEAARHAAEDEAEHHLASLSNSSL